ncbi:MAG: hypothetical protein GW805_13435 [Ignavibacteria bacterium]|nr:hypothetical protein [Ignavibacteria bacterium]NCS82718.1 hypothetical protein [Ignavibacteria bacterium]OIO17399.1 MAG: hypothetical protein AUJ54_09860 [Ignavibacteria bacterium CG1_02_37_35]PJC58813.1 MAG: hypothetical protein CO025_08165 [Ignavibacteria bacterium CG_4_9_14_0_2_um_filter_37_13]
METKSILLEIERLPVEEKMLIVERTIKAIREKELREKMTGAVAELEEEYRKNSELTAFTGIDFENFYETR